MLSVLLTLWFLQRRKKKNCFDDEEVQIKKKILLLLLNKLRCQSMCQCGINKALQKWDENIHEVKSKGINILSSLIVFWPYSEMNLEYEAQSQLVHGAVLYSSNKQLYLW
jgi:hypothetical protein